jgi:hypothetical protein
VGFCGIFGQFSWLGVGSVKAAFSRPAHQPVTPAVACNNMGYMFNPSKIAKFCRVFDDSRLKRV